MGHTIPSDFSGKNNFSVTFRLPGRGESNLQACFSGQRRGVTREKSGNQDVGLLQ